MKWGRGVWICTECHCGAPAAVGTGELRALVAADRTGEPVRGPSAVEAGKADIPEEGGVIEMVRQQISAGLVCSVTREKGTTAKLIPGRS